MPAAATRVRHRAPPEARRAQILEAALQCFAEKGYHAATMDDLVRASGLSKGSLYWHFESKQDVFLALFDRFTAEIFAGWEAVAAGDAPALERLRRFGEIAVGSIAAQRPLLRAWLEFFAHAEARERLARVYRQSRERLAETLRRGIASGEIRDVPVEAAAVSLTALVEGLLLQAAVDPTLDARAHFPGLWAVVRRGLEA